MAECLRPLETPGSAFSEISASVFKEMSHSAEADVVQDESLKCTCCLFNRIFCWFCKSPVKQSMY